MLPDLSRLCVRPVAETMSCVLKSFPFLSIDYERILQGLRPGASASTDALDMDPLEVQSGAKRQRGDDDFISINTRLQRIRISKARPELVAVNGEDRKLEKLRTLMKINRVFLCIQYLEDDIQDANWILVMGTERPYNFAYAEVNAVTGKMPTPSSGRVSDNQYFHNWMRNSSTQLYFADLELSEEGKLDAFGRFASNALLSDPSVNMEEAHMQWLRLIRLPSIPDGRSGIKAVSPQEAESLLKYRISPRIGGEDLMEAYKRATEGINRLALPGLSLGQAQIDNSVGGIFYGLDTTPDDKMKAIIRQWKSMAIKHGILYGKATFVEEVTDEMEHEGEEQQEETVPSGEKLPRLSVEHIVPRSWFRVTKTICQFSSCEHDLILCYVTASGSNSSRRDRPLPFSRRRMYRPVWGGTRWEERVARDDETVMYDVSFPVSQRAFVARATLYAYLSYPCICKDPEQCVMYGKESDVYGPQLEDMIVLAQLPPEAWEINLNRISFQNYGLVNPFVVSSGCRDLLKPENAYHPLRILLRQRILGTDSASRAVFAELRKGGRQ